MEIVEIFMSIWIVVFSSCWQSFPNQLPHYSEQWVGQMWHSIWNILFTFGISCGCLVIVWSFGIVGT
jgi:hypothetical protein